MVKKSACDKELHKLARKFEKDKMAFLKKRTRYSTNFPFEFEDYVNKYANRKTKSCLNKRLVK